MILSIVVLATFSAALQGYKASKQQLNQVFDEEMQSIAFTIKYSLSQPSTKSIDTHSSFAFQVWKNGQLLVKSKNAPDEIIAMRSASYGYKSFLGDRWRYYSKVEDETQVIVAQPVAQRIKLIEAVLLEAILPIVYIIPVIGFVIFFTIRKSLFPLKSLSNQLQEKDAADLTPIELQTNSTDLIPIETTINDLLTRLSAAFEREQSLASNAAHELRTPISVLKLTAHNMKVAQQTSGITPQHIQDLAVSTDLMAHVIEQVITLNRTTPENFSAKKTYVKLDELLQTVISNNFADIEQSQQSISLNMSPILIFADQFSLETLFDNLLKNAVKYSGEGSEILISAYQENDKVICIVEDSGPGIENSELDKVVQRFYRVKQHQQAGSGLGLSIVNHIVKLHQGEILLEQSSLGGLKAVIILPKQKAEME